jgi:hypothetical protein
VALVQQQQLAEKKNATLVVAIAGTLLAGAVAMGTPAYRSVIVRLLAALPFGALWGAATGFLGAVLYQKLIPTAIQPAVSDTVKVQALFFACLGLGVGALMGALCRGGRGLPAGVLGGALAGGLGGLAYPILAAIALSSQSTEHLIPEGTSVRLLWLILPFTAIGFLVPAMLNPPRSAAAPEAAEPVAAT